MRSSLFPLRTCFIAFSPHPASDQTEITARVGLSYLLLSAGKENRGISAFPPPLLNWRDTERFNWCLDAGTMLSGFWTERG